MTKLKTDIVTKLKTQIVKIQNKQNSKTQIATQLNNSTCDKSPKVKFGQNSKTQILTIQTLKNITQSYGQMNFTP